jgi:predicted aldo/keto reductase-like oxidoreductase
VACRYVTKALETLPQCVECGTCLPKCPYNLPIPDMLKKHYALFREHRRLYHNE